MTQSFVSKLTMIVLPFALSAVVFAAEPTPAPAPAPAAAAPHRNAIVDMQRIILTVEEGKEARGALEKEIKAKEIEFQKKKEELDKLNKEWKDQSPLLSEEARIRKQQDFQKKLMDLRDLEMGFQNQIKQKEGEATQRIAMKVSGIVHELVSHQNIEAVYEVNSSGLVYLKNPVDLTEQVIKKYNEVAKNEKKAPAAIKEAAKPTVNNKKM